MRQLPSHDGTGHLSLSVDYILVQVTTQQKTIHRFNQETKFKWK
jgi:hypothetical protein